MKTYFTLAGLVTVSFVAYLGCAEVKFEAIPPSACDNMNSAYGGGSCVVANGSMNYDYDVTVGDVDILFVDDNSGSMYTEQTKMANQFPGFLDSISTLNYQIGIITTDVSSTGAGKRGQFLSFSNGSRVLSNSSRIKDSTHYSNVTQFQNTIKRNETLLCPNQAGCPSGDERGIYALNQALDRSDNSSFFRPGGHLAVVILSDEDERSSGGGAPGSEINGGAISNSYKAEDYDMPMTFAQKAKQQLRGAKSVSVHSIIIRPQTSLGPADTGCWNAQNNQGNDVKGFYGTQYAMLSVPSEQMKGISPIVPGTLGSICAANYTNEMGQIASFLNRSDIQLPCTPEGNLKIETTPNMNVNYTLDSDNILHFSPSLQAGVKVNLQFSCQL